MHYGLGMMPGAIYGALRGRVAYLDAGRGSFFGLGLFLIKDEGMNAALGLSGKLQDYPWTAHARGLAAHLAYGRGERDIHGFANRHETNDGHTDRPVSKTDTAKAESEIVAAIRRLRRQ